MSADVSATNLGAVVSVRGSVVASENASRLAAMQRADKNIDDLLSDLNGKFHRLRQSGIDEERFDVVAGFEALGGSRTGKVRKERGP